MMDVGLEYLTLDRKAGTLSGGEAQRIRLASQIGSRLVGTLYISGRADDRPASARQREAYQDAPGSARPRQHDHRRRARRGHDPRIGLSRGYRPGARACMAATCRGARADAGAHQRYETEFAHACNICAARNSSRCRRRGAR